MSTGMIEGGLEYMWAAYGVVWFGLLTYGSILVARWRMATEDQPDREKKS